MKIFNIGLSKTGTNSLVDALGILGFNLVHYPSQNIISDIEQCDGSSDIPTALRFKELDERFPGSKFILTVRDKASWLESVRKHFHRRPSSTLSEWGKQNREEMYGSVHSSQCDFMGRYNLEGAYHRHHKEVREYFADRPDDLLVIDICGGEGWGKICEFLGVDVPDIAFPRSNEAPKKMEQIDIVIPYLKQPDAWDSLRYVIRAACENFVDLRNVWIVGEKPEWVNDSVKFISNPSSYSDQTLVRNRHYCYSMFLASIHPEISDTFLYMADDHYIAVPRTAQDFRETTLVRENMSAYTQDERRTANTEWQRMIWKTVDKLMDYGYTAWNYETHTPKLIEKIKLIECMSLFGFGDGDFIWQTVYGNLYSPSNVQGWLSESTPLKAGFYNDTTSPEEIQERCEAAIYINHNDDGLQEPLIEYLTNRFSTPSRFESVE